MAIAHVWFAPVAILVHVVCTVPGGYVAVGIGVIVAVAVHSGFGVMVAVAVRVTVGVSVTVGVEVTVHVALAVGVEEGGGTRDAVGYGVGVTVGTMPETVTGTRLRDPKIVGTPSCPLPFVPQHHADDPVPMAQA